MSNLHCMLLVNPEGCIGSSGRSMAQVSQTGGGGTGNTGTYQPTVPLALPCWRGHGGKEPGWHPERRPDGYLCTGKVPQNGRVWLSGGPKWNPALGNRNWAMLHIFQKRRYG